MNIKANAGRNRKADLRDHCESMDLRAQCDAEATFLAAFYRAVVFGGEITVKLHKQDEEPTSVEFFGINSPEPEGSPS